METSKKKTHSLLVKKVSINLKSIRDMQEQRYLFKSSYDNNFCIYIRI